jgi:hypothetical protein
LVVPRTRLLAEFVFLPAQVDYKPIKNWIGVDWNKFEEKYYPSGGDAWVQKMGNISMT